MVKTVIKKLVRNLGFELKRYKPNLSETARMQQLLAYHKIDLVFDIGANIGQYAMFLREIGYSGRIVSFEPLSSAHAQLQALSSKDPCGRLHLGWQSGIEMITSLFKSRLTVRAVRF